MPVSLHTTNTEIPSLTFFENITNAQEEVSNVQPCTTTLKAEGY